MWMLLCKVAPSKILLETNQLLLGHGVHKTAISNMILFTTHYSGMLEDPQGVDPPSTFPSFSSDSVAVGCFRMSLAHAEPHNLQVPKEA